MTEPSNPNRTSMDRRDVLRAAGAVTVAGIASTGAAAASTIADRPLGARLQGMQHFGLTVQNMERAYAFYTEVLGGTEIMRDGDFQGERIHNTLMTTQETRVLIPAPFFRERLGAIAALGRTS